MRTIQFVTFQQLSLRIIKSKLFGFGCIFFGIMGFVWLQSAEWSSVKPIKFDHPFHIIDAGLSCADCHTGIETASQGTRVIPDHETCATCHNLDDIESCAMCHLNPDAPTAMPVVAGRYEGFAHDAHIAAGIECAACHGEMQLEGAQPAFPAMADCQACHMQKSATLDCASCHRGESPKPVDHFGVAWQSEHGLEAAALTSDCAMCHDQSSCDECHQGLNLFGSPHPPTWRFNHFAESSFGAECMSCHESREYCAACHRASIRVPHGFGEPWANSETGGAHVAEARAFADACIACHDVGNVDPTCARCHD